MDHKAIYEACAYHELRGGKIVKLFNSGNSIHNALSSENLSPERKKSIKVRKLQNVQIHVRIERKYQKSCFMGRPGYLRYSLLESVFIRSG